MRYEGKKKSLGCYSLGEDSPLICQWIRLWLLSPLQRQLLCLLIFHFSSLQKFCVILDVWTRIINLNPPPNTLMNVNMGAVLEPMLTEDQSRK